MNIESLWNLFGTYIVEICLVGLGASVITETVKRLWGDQLARWLPAFPPVLAMLGMLMAEASTIPPDNKGKLHWLVVFASLGLFTGSVSGQLYKFIKDAFFKKLGAPAEQEPEQNRP